MKLRSIAAIGAIGAGFLAAGSAKAAQDPIDVLIQRLVDRNVIKPEDGDSIRAEIDQIEKQNQADAAKAKPAATTHDVTAKTALKVSGYVQARYQNSDKAGAANSFDTRRVRLTLSGDAIPNRLGYNLQVDFAGGQKALTNTTGSTANFGKTQLLDGYVEYKWNPQLHLTAGQFKVPFGQENLQSDALLDTINRSLVNEAIVPGRDTGSLGRDEGLQLSGSSKPDVHSGAFDYFLGVFNGTAYNSTDDNKGKDVAARLVWRPAVDGLSVGASVYDGKKGSPTVKRDREGVEASFVRNLSGAKGEYVWAKDATVKKNGYYLTGLGRVSKNTQAVLRYERFDPNSDTGGDDQNAWTGGLNYYLTKDLLNKVQVNYERHRDSGGAVKYNTFLAQFQAGF